MVFINNKLFLKSKDLYNNIIVDYSENVSSTGTQTLTKDQLENEYNDQIQIFDRIDTYEGLFSTQQIFNLNWDRFEKHTFFDSAVAKVNYVFDKLLNDFKYDPTYKEYNQLIKNLDGYTHYILKERFPKSYNCIYLGESYVEVIDKPGVILKEMSKPKGFMNPFSKPFNFDFWFNLDNTILEDNRIIAQKLDTVNNTGFTLYINNKSEKTLNLLITNLNNEFIKSTIDISDFISTEKYTFDKNSQKGYIHASVTVQSKNLDTSKKEVRFYLNGKRVFENNTGELTLEFIDNKDTTFSNASLLIGNGYDHIVDGDSNLTIRANNSGFSGLIDEFRFFHKTRSLQTIIKESATPIFSQDELILYLKFNEPSGIYNNSFLALDSSGNKLHGQIKYSNDFNTIASSIDLEKYREYLPAPIFKEQDYFFPVVFPDLKETKELLQYLLEKANRYDSINPNIIFNLFPKYYFIEGSDFENNLNIFANPAEYSSNENLGINLPANQEFVNILLIWARFFDELKCYIDNFTEIINTSYDDLNNTTPFGAIIPLATKLMGFDFKDIFPSATKEKLDGYNLTHNKIKNEITIRKVQNEIWKRVLINSQDFLRSKGTVNSIRSIFNSVGIEADRFVDIKEYNGKNRLLLQASNKIYSQNIRFLDFADNSFLFEENTLTDEIPDYKPRLSTDYIYDQFSPNPATSGSFTYEGYYRFNETKKTILSLTQSLCLLNKENIALTEDIENINRDEVYEPIICLSFVRSKIDNESGTLKLEIQPTQFLADYNKIEIENINLFNGQTWHISFGRRNISGENKWENFLYIKSAGDKKYEPYHYVKKEQNLIGMSANNFGKDIPTFLSIGLRTLNSNILGLGPETPTLFEGEVSNIRFYNTNLMLEELLQRSNDITYVGFEDALNKRKLVLNLDFSEEITESSVLNNEITDANFINFNDKSDFEVGKQAWHPLAELEVLDEDENNIQRQKFSLNTRLSSSLTTKNTPENLLSCIKTRNVLIIKNDARFDEVFNSEKIKIHSFEDETLVKLNNGIQGPNSVTNPDMTQFNHARLSIEHSNVKYLNQDISKMIGSISFLNKAYGLSSNIYDTDYLDIKAAREIYFEKLTREIDFKPMQQVFKYFDNILSDLLEDSIPSKVNYMGFNYIYESHALERHKYEYKMSECRIPIEDEGYNFSREVINSPRTEDSIRRRSYTMIESATDND